MKNKLYVAVPTSTVIAHHTENRFKVAVFRSAGKHGDKLVLPGGRLKVGRQNWLEAAIAEADEELGIKKLLNIKLFCLCSMPNRDVRKISLEKLLDGNEMPDNFPEDIEIVGHYGYDVVFMAETDDVLSPDKDEAKEAFYLDIREMDPDDFAMDHGKILLAYRDYIRTGELPALDQF
jgi:ADP-ribose pyrophosphatase YjhB (NUDIX family)